MKISAISVRNFRSIEHTVVDVDDLSIFVGQNNHGKTNFFEAIEWFYSSARSSADDCFFDMNTRNTIEVNIAFVGVTEDDIEKLSTEANKTKIRNLLDGETSFNIRKTSSDHKKVYVVNGEDRQNPAGLDAAVIEFIPKLEYVNTRIRLEDVSQYKDKNPIGQMLSGVLTAIISESPEYREFRQKFNDLFDDENSEVRVKLNELADEVSVYVKKQFPGDIEVKFTVNPPQFSDLLKSFDTTVNDGVNTKAQAKGDGMQRAIMLAIIQAFADYRKRQHSGSCFLFMIDEAELHLHPSAQRLLKKALEDISGTDQVLINTHSSVIVVDECDNQKLFKVEKENRVTSITPVQEIEKIDIIFELLGGSPYDLLLPRNFLVVEGKSDYEFLTRIIKKFYSDEFKGLKVLFSGGDITRQRESIDAVNKALAPLVGPDHAIYKPRLVVLLDQPNSDQQQLYQDFQEGYPYLFDTGRVFELPFPSLEEYYPDNWRKTAEEVHALQDVPNGKKNLAIEVADAIAQDAFESEMSVMFEALVKCNQEAFN